MAAIDKLERQDAAPGIVIDINTATVNRLFYLDQTGQIAEFDLTDRDALDMALLGFGQDGAGELYVLANTTGTPFGETGVVLRIDPEGG